MKSNLVFPRHLERMRFKTSKGQLENCTGEISKIVIKGHAEQFSCAEKIFTYNFFVGFKEETTERKTAQITNVFDDVGRNNMWTTISICNRCPSYKVYLKEYIRRTMNDITGLFSGVNGDGNLEGVPSSTSDEQTTKSMSVDWILSKNAQSIELVCQEGETECTNHVIPSATLTRFEQPTVGHPCDFTLLNSIDLTIGNKSLSVNDITLRCNKERTKFDCLVLDIEHKHAYIEKWIQIDVAETRTTHIFDNYTVLDEPEIVEIKWLPEYELVALNGITPFVNSSNVITDIDIWYYAKGIKDGLPPVRDSIVSAYDGWNNVGLFMQQNFKMPGVDLYGNSKINYHNYQNYGESRSMLTPYGREGLYFRGNFEMVDLRNRMAKEEITYTLDDITYTSTTTLNLDSKGMLAKAPEKTSEDEDADTIETFSTEYGEYIVSSNLTYTPYSYMASLLGKKEGYVQIFMPENLDPNKGVTIQIVSRLTNSQDSYNCGTINSTITYNLEEKGYVAVDPYKDFSLLLRGIPGNANVFFNDKKILTSPIFSDTGDGWKYVYEDGTEIVPEYATTDFYVGFYKDSNKEENNRIYHGMYVYAIYIYITHC